MRASLLPALILPLCLVGCAAGADTADAPASAGGSSGTGGQANTNLPSSLEFEMVPGLNAREHTSLTLRARPAKAYRVRLTLPASDVAHPLDAVLDQAEVVTDAQGFAKVGLTAPSSSTTFVVRASVEGIVATLPIKVSDTGVATLLIQPQYAGFRPITTWVASAYEDTTCAELAGIPPEDGPLQSLPSSSRQAPELLVPANKRLAITLRSGHFVGGCASLEQVAAGVADQPQTVKVTVLDRPIDLGASQLALSLGFAAPGAAWEQLLGANDDDLLQALRGASSDDVDALLDAMREASKNSEAFEAARQSEGWDSLLQTTWGLSAATRIQGVVKGWLKAGRQNPSDSEHVFVGALAPIAQADTTAPEGDANFTLDTVAGLDAAKAGFVSRAHVAWSASSDDTVSLDTDLYYVRSQLAAALAEIAARGALPETVTAADALSAQLDCTALADVLSVAGVDTSVSFAACDASCTATLCNKALAAIWQRGVDASSATPERLKIAATGGARVGEAAQVAGISGTWIGQAALGSASGILTAAEPVVTP